jgi:hypothetical protein
MSENDKSLLRAPPDYSDPDRYRQGSNGAVFDRETGRIVTMDPTRNPHAITKENAAEFVRRRDAKARIDYLRGIIIGRGEEPPEGATLEELEELAGESRVHAWSHWYKTFMKSSNLRGMAESGRALLDGPKSTDDEDGAGDRDNRPRVLVLLAELTRRRENPGEIIDG